MLLFSGCLLVFLTYDELLQNFIFFSIPPTPCFTWNPILPWGHSSSSADFLSRLFPHIQKALGSGSKVLCCCVNHHSSKIVEKSNYFPLRLMSSCLHKHSVLDILSSFLENNDPWFNLVLHFNFYQNLLWLQYPHG